MRVFVAVSFSSEVCGRIGQAVEELRASSPASKWVRASDCHITLAFLGQVDDAVVPKVAAAVEEAASRHGPLGLHLKGGGSFGRPRRPRVLWASVGGDIDALAAVQRDVVAALARLGFAPEDRPFTPHVTLARAREQGGDAGLAACAEALKARELGESRVDEVIVYRSDLSAGGPSYTALARAPLAALQSG